MRTVWFHREFSRRQGGEQFDKRLQGSLRKEPNALQKQIKRLNWFCAFFQTHLHSGETVRYENVVNGSGLALIRLNGNGAALPVPLESRIGKRGCWGV